MCRSIIIAVVTTDNGHLMGKHSNWVWKNRRIWAELRTMRLCTRWARAILSEDEPYFHTCWGCSIYLSVVVSTIFLLSCAGGKCSRRQWNQKDHQEGWLCLAGGAWFFCGGVREKDVAQTAEHHGQWLSPSPRCAGTGALSAVHCYHHDAPKNATRNLFSLCKQTLQLI